VPPVPFKKSDFVRLKSNGRSMIVEGFGHRYPSMEPIVYCKWLDDGWQQSAYAPDELEPEV